jgi:hypothetical protein
MSEVDVVRVIEVFEANQSRWALVGAHAIGLLTEPRATADFDFIVEETRVRAILRDLNAAFGDLDANDIGAAIQLKAIDIDLIRSANHPLFGEALTQARRVGEWNVPRTEVLIALKFLASVSPWRDRNKRRQDVVDLSLIYTAECDLLDKSELERLGALVYPGAEAELRVLLGRIERGEPLTI